MSKLLGLLITIVVGIVLTLGGRWYMYVTNTKSPYDEIGIEVNRYMPQPVRAWGCGKLQETFPKFIPPDGCAKPDGNGREWM
jgi:hypothetical protein